MRDVKDLALDFYAACREASVACAFIGGLAVMAWGQPRATSDVDALNDADEDRADAVFDRFVASLASRGLSVNRRELEIARHEGSHVIIHDDGSNFHVDAVFARTPAERSEIEGAVMVTLSGGSEIPIAPPEETIAFKLKFGTPQDIADARGILARQRPRLDLARVRAVAEGLGVVALWETLLAERRG